jgi:hypothetical protein
VNTQVKRRRIFDWSRLVVLLFALGLVCGGMPEYANGATPPPPKPPPRSAHKSAPKSAPKPKAVQKTPPKTTLKPHPVAKATPKRSPTPKAAPKPKSPAKRVAHSARNPVRPPQRPAGMRNGQPLRSTMAQGWMQAKRAKTINSVSAPTITSSMHHGNALVRSQSARVQTPVAISQAPSYLKGGGTGRGGSGSGKGGGGKAGGGQGGGRGGDGSGGGSGGPRSSKLSAQSRTDAHRTSGPLTAGQQQGSAKLSSARLDPRGGAKNVDARKALRTKLSALQSGQRDATRTRKLQDGRIRYYGRETPARQPGATRGASYVTEWNPRTGRVRSWMESYDQAGKVNRVHPKMRDGQQVASPHYPPTGREAGSQR